MKLLHLSDLHFGRKLENYSLYDDHLEIIRQIIETVKKEAPDAVMICGDVYDKPTPSEDAVKLFDKLLTELNDLNVKTLIINGNHDSAERVAFGGRIMEKSNIFISPVYNGELKYVDLSDEVRVYLMPFINRTVVRNAFPDIEVSSITDAVKTVLEHTELDKSRINILMAHQFVTGKPDGSDVLRTDDQSLAVGGCDNVDVKLFADFDYLALGHIHRPQDVGGETVRYCGSPLAYYFDDDSVRVNDNDGKGRKSITVVEISGKADIHTRTVDFAPLYGLRILEGTFAEVMSYTDDGSYTRVVLTETGISDVGAKLAAKFERYTGVYYKSLNAHFTSSKGAKDLDSKTTIDIIGEFFKEQNSTELNDAQKKICEQLLNELEKEEL